MCLCGLSLVFCTSALVYKCYTEWNIKECKNHTQWLVAQVTSFKSFQANFCLSFKSSRCDPSYAPPPISPVLPSMLNSDWLRLPTNQPIITDAQTSFACMPQPITFQYISMKSWFAPPPPHPPRIDEIAHS